MIVSFYIFLVHAHALKIFTHSKINIYLIFFILAQHRRAILFSVRYGLASHEFQNHLIGIFLILPFQELYQLIILKRGYYKYLFL